eukprot:g65564.t1
MAFSLVFLVVLVKVGDKIQNTTELQGSAALVARAMVEKQKKKEKQKSSEEHDLKTYLIAGGTAGIISRTAIAPIERVKIIYQVSHASSMGSYHSLPMQILRNEGFLSLWKGNSAAVLRVIPYMCVTFVGFEEYKSLLKHHLSDTPLNLAAGSMAGCTAVALTYPLDLVRATLALQAEGKKPGQYGTNFFSVLVNMCKAKGFAGMYRGISPTMAGVIPYAGLKFASYEAMKPFLSMWGDGEIHPTTRLAAGASAGLVAQTFVYPFDIMRRRMQTHEGKGHKYPSVWSGLKQIAREEGIRKGLYRGMTLNYMKTIPNVSIYMSVYDIVKVRIQQGNAKASA